MSKSKKEVYPDTVTSTSLRRTIINAPSSTNRRPEDHDGFTRTSRSKSSDSSPERKKSKFGKPVARGSESGIIFDKGELKKISITITNKLAKPPLVHFTNPETITPIRRPDEGKRPIFSKVSKEDSDSSEERTSSSRENPIEYRRKGEWRKRLESPEEQRRRRRSRRDSSSGRKRRRNRLSPSRAGSCSSDSSSSSGSRRRRRKHGYRIRPEREREREDRDRDRDRKRREYESKMLRDLDGSHQERVRQRPPSPPSPSQSPQTTNGGKEPCYSRDAINMTLTSPTPPPPPPGGVGRGMYPGVVRVVRPPPPYPMMRPGLHPFGPSVPFGRVPPGYPPPPRPAFFPPAPHPHPVIPPPVPFRPRPRLLRPPPPGPRGFFRP